MGIRFHCPNGHKLNVKAFLAGKKGVCPDCGTKFRIPERSEPGLESGIDDAPVKAQLSEPAPAQKTAYSSGAITSRPAVMTPIAPMPTSHAAAMPVSPVIPISPVMPVSPSAPLASNVPRAVAAYPPPPMSMPAPMPPHMAQPMGRPMAAPAMQMPPPPPPPMPGGPGAGDPLTENPLATWFVRPPSGGQFGPARGEVMRKWITEGRVTSDSLVWREGWTDWLNATDVFPSLGKPAPLFSASAAATKSSAALPAKKKGSSLGVAILICLVLICVVLVGVLAVVLSGSLSST